MPNKQPTRQSYATAISDIFKELLRVENATVHELSEACGMKPENLRKWLRAFEEVGIFEQSEKRKITPQTPGYGARAWRLAAWIKKE